MSENTNDNVENTVQQEVSYEPQVVVTKKDPKRVEQGKRLAMISKQAKERKLREKLENEAKQSWTSYTTTYIFPVVAVVSTSGLLYLWWSKPPKKIQVQQSPPENNSKEHPTTSVPPPKKHPVVSRFESFE